MCLGTHLHGPTAGSIGIPDTCGTHDQAASREVRPLDDSHQLLHGSIRIVNQHQHAINYLVHVVRRYVSGHAYGNARGAVHQKLRILGRQHGRLLQGLIVVRHEVHGILVNILQHQLGNLGHANLGVTHCCCRVSIHGAEVAVAVCQHIAHGEILRHADNRIIHGAIAVRMIFTQNLAHNTGGLLVWLAGGHACLLHSVQYSSMNRLQSITDIWQSSGDDYAHGIINIGITHFLLQIYR